MLDDLLSNVKCNINAYDAQGYALIHWAARYGYTACIDTRIKHGADIEITTLVKLLFLLLSIEQQNSSGCGRLFRFL